MASTYFTIDGKDFSHFVNELKVVRNHNYNAQMNANGDTVVDYINAKYSIDVGFRPLNQTEAEELFTAIEEFSVLVGFRAPVANTERQARCISPTEEFEYYLIHGEETLSKPFTLTFSQL
jgi:hypothetical protein